MKHYYYYDSQKCEFVTVEYRNSDRIVHTLTTWLTVGLVIAGLLIGFLVSFAGTPAEIALKSENSELLKQFRQSQSRIDQLSDQIALLAEKDNEVYRTVLGIDPISYDERLAGAGGADFYDRFDGLRESTANLLRSASFELENIERRIQIQNRSLEEVKEFYNSNETKMRHLPVMRPVDGVVLSGYGMRLHPVLGVRRMHEGIDFRARVGTPVYAPGDGVVKFAANRAGGYGLLVEIDHGYSYVTRYAHLSAFADGIRPGKRIKRGDLIAYTGRTGRVSGPHLHYEIHRNGRAVDPLNYMFADMTPQEYRMFVDINRKSNSTSN